LQIQVNRVASTRRKGQYIIDVPSFHNRKKANR